MQPLLVTGISTGVGKTIVSAVLAQALHADYWKPLQTGQESDTMEVASLLSNPHSRCHPEAYSLKAPLSPHHAARLEHRELFPFPCLNIEAPLIIEGSGGPYSPFNEKMTQWDLFRTWKITPLLVVSHYLGSINHALLAIEAICPTGLLFNGKSCPASEEFLLNYTHLPCLGRIPKLRRLNKRTINCTAITLRKWWKKIGLISGTLSLEQNRLNFFSRKGRALASTPHPGIDTSMRSRHGGSPSMATATPTLRKKLPDKHTDLNT